MAQFPAPISTIRFNPIQSNVAAVCVNTPKNTASIQLWDITSGSVVGVLEHGETLIRDISFSEDGKQIASVGDDKNIRVWDLATFQCIKIRKCPKKLSTVSFAGSDEIIYSNRFGHVFSFKLGKAEESNEESSDPILGHFSTISDMIITNGYIFTSDKDEKIRISHFPRAYDIQSFCLGHTSFVTKIVQPSDFPELLVSGSGDGTLRLWRYAVGKNIQTLYPVGETTPASNVVPLCYLKSLNIVAVKIEGEKLIRLFKLADDTLSEISQIQLEGEAYDARFNAADSSLWIVGKHSPVQVFKIEANGVSSEITSDAVANLKKAVPQVGAEDFEKISKSFLWSTQMAKHEYTEEPPKKKKTADN